MKKILHFIGSLEVGGTEKMLLSYLTNTHDKSLEHVVYTLYDRGVLKGEFESRGITVKTLGIKGKLGLFGAIDAFVKILETENPEVVHSYLLSENLVARYAIGKFRKKHPEHTVVLVNGKRDTDRGKVFWKVWLDRQSLRKADLHVSNSKTGINELISYGVPSNQIICIPNGKPVSARADKEEARRNMGIAGNVFLIGYVARLYEFKGHEYLLEAVATLKSNLPRLNWKLMLVGDGSMRTKLMTKTQQLGLQYPVIFTGERNDVANILPAFDLFVFPSLREGMPGALMEAMAAGVPCIATNIDGCKELITDQKNGILVPPKDSNALAQAMELLERDEAKRMLLGSEARKTIEAEFSLEAMVKNLDKLYASLT